jgi:hypothetical protein
MLPPVNLPAVLLVGHLRLQPTVPDSLLEFFEILAVLLRTARRIAFRKPTLPPGGRRFSILAPACVLKAARMT